MNLMIVAISVYFKSFSITIGCLHGLFLNNSSKNGLQADRTTLWAFMLDPSHAKVTSTRDWEDKSSSKTVIRFPWWLFHFKQNCWVSIFWGGGGERKWNMQCQSMSFILIFYQSLTYSISKLKITQSLYISKMQKTPFRFSSPLICFIMQVTTVRYSNPTKFMNFNVIIHSRNYIW